MSVVLVTGAFRGLGREICLLLRENGHLVVAIGRDPLQDFELENMYTLDWDMRNPTAIPSKALEAVISTSTQSVVLIHNAATLGPLRPLSAVPVSEFLEAINVNLVSGIALTSKVIERTREVGGSLTVLLVSSGAAQRAIADWGTYCTTKAAMEMYIRCLAEDDASIRCMVFEPGVMDTKMQLEIAEWNSVHGREVSSHALQPASEVALRVVQALQLGESTSNE
jgi:benzil reductase ((S)-benzoin forming)